MADYYPLIAKAVSGLDKSTGEARRALYDRARTALLAQLRGVEPIYETIAGWQERTAGARSFAELPAPAIKYVRRIEELVGCPLALLSTSPEREDTILMRNPFEM